MFGSRRDFIKTVAAGAAGLSMGLGTGTHLDAAGKECCEKSPVSFLHGGDRRKLIREVLKPLEKKIRHDVKGKQVIVKPNCVWDANPLCASDVDAIRGVLDFLKPFYKETVVVAESTASPAGTMKCFEDYKYTGIPKDYDVELVDLNQDTYSIEWILGENRHPLHVKIIDTFLDPKNYIISLSRMKSHNCVVVTLSTKNMLMASPINLPEGHPAYVGNRLEKRKMHEGDPVGTNYNMYQIAHKVRPQLAIIDGFVGMEGNGPREGTPKEHGVALAGFDMIAVDRIGIELMGVPYEDVAYLQWCSNSGLGQGDISQIAMTGPDYTPHKKKYKLHDRIEWQLEWKKKAEDKG